jgi:translation initiation factor IF-3
MANYRKRPRNPNANVELTYRLNSDIQADTVRIIDSEGGMVGIMPFTEALKLAESKELDLVEINPKATPPVVKMVDYNKFKYQILKTVNKPKVKEEKTLRVSVRVSSNDLQVRANQASGFLDDGHKVKLQVQMRGREKAYPEVAKEVMTDFIARVTTTYELESTPKQTGDSVFAFLKHKK